jgi:hypothetical protein
MLLRANKIKFSLEEGGKKKKKGKMLMQFTNLELNAAAGKTSPHQQIITHLQFTITNTCFSILHHFLLFSSRGPPRQSIDQRVVAQ